MTANRIFLRSASGQYVHFNLFLSTLIPVKIECSDYQQKQEKAILNLLIYQFSSVVCDDYEGFNTFNIYIQKGAYLPYIN